MIKEKQSNILIPEAFVHLGRFQVSPWDKREEASEKKLGFAVANSDHLALLQAYKVLTVIFFFTWYERHYTV